MRRPRLGSFCTGYGGLDLGVSQVLDVEHAWHSELDPDASAVLGARFPGVPNLGDLRAVDWSAVEPVDVLTGRLPLPARLRRRPAQGHQRREVALR